MATVIKTFSVSPEANTPRGLSYDGRNLWVVGSTNNDIVVYDKLGNIIRIIAIGSIDTSPDSMVFIGGRIYIPVNIKFLPS